MDKCTFGAGGPEPDSTEAEYAKYGANRLAEGKLPLCAEMCSTQSLLAVDGEIIDSIYSEQVTRRRYGAGSWRWGAVYIVIVNVCRTGGFGAPVKPGGEKHTTENATNKVNRHRR